MHTVKCVSYFVGQLFLPNLNKRSTKQHETCFGNYATVSTIFKTLLPFLLAQTKI